MEDTQLLDLCLSITGRFEGGTPSFTALVGDFDGAGMSAGILQWNPFSGTLQKLVGLIGAAMGWDKAKTFFVSDIHAFSTMNPKDGIAFVYAHFLDSTDKKKLSPAAITAWKAFLSSPEGITAQRSLASSTVLTHAKSLAAKFTPAYASRTRTIAFFFDLCTQQGSMSTVPVSANPTAAGAIAFAQGNDPACAALWTAAAANDLLCTALLYYAYERAKLAKAAYIWNALARRGSIAARKGILQHTHFDFTAQLD